MNASEPENRRLLYWLVKKTDHQHGLPTTQVGTTL